MTNIIVLRHADPMGGSDPSPKRFHMKCFASYIERRHGRYKKGVGEKILQHMLLNESAWPSDEKYILSLFGATYITIEEFTESNLFCYGCQDEEEYNEREARREKCNS